VSAALWFIAGVIASFIASIFANYYTPTFSQLLASQKSWFVERNRMRALRGYELALALHTGKRDKHLHILGMWSRFIALCIIFATAIILFSFRAFVVNGHIFAVGTFIAPLFVAYALWKFVLIELLRWRLDSFELYEKRLIERWGAITEEELLRIEENRNKAEAF
jgi:hypothetical protein